MNERFKFRALECERINMAEKAKLASKAYCDRIIRKAAITAVLVISWLMALHFTLVNLDGAHRPWLHQLCWVIAGITVYTASCTISDTLKKKRLLRIALVQIELYGHVERTKDTERGFEAAFLEVYKSKDKKKADWHAYEHAHLCLLILDAPDTVELTSCCDGSFNMVNYTTEGGRHVCFCTDRSLFFQFFAAIGPGKDVLSIRSGII